MARRPAEGDRIEERLRDDRYGVGELLRSDRARYRARHDDVGLETDELLCQHRGAGLIALRVADLEAVIAAFHVAQFAHALREAAEVSLGRGI
jgi:hypothetical protein